MDRPSPENTRRNPFERASLKRGKPDGRPGPWVLLAAWGPCGFLPGAPGTWGTAGAVPAFWLLRDLPLALYALTVAGLTAIACFAAAQAGRYWKYADASPIVIDEVVGYLVGVALVPWTWQWALAGFVFFRLFDVLKPWPASAFDRIKTGVGVVLDDVAAGVWTLATLEILRVALRLAAGCAGSRWWCLQLTP